MKKVLNVLGNIVVTLIMIFAVIMTVAIVSSSFGKKAKLPNLFGYALLSVQTDSMEGENGFFVGDLIVDKLVDEEQANNLKVGDVITFIRSMGDEQYLETHRIVEHQSDKPTLPSEIVDGVWMREGRRYYTTQGDNEMLADRTQLNTIEYTSQFNIIGVWTGIRVPKLGAVMDFLQSSLGFMLCVVLPVALFFMYQLYIFIMTLSRHQKEKAIAEVADKEAELKQKAIEEFLAQQQASGGAPAPDSTAPAEPDPAPPAAEETPAPKDDADPADAPADISDAEKDRFIREYLAKQAQENKGE